MEEIDDTDNEPGIRVSIEVWRGSSLTPGKKPEICRWMSFVIEKDGETLADVEKFREEMFCFRDEVLAEIQKKYIELLAERDPKKESEPAKPAESVQNQPLVDSMTNPFPTSDGTITPLQILFLDGA